MNREEACVVQPAHQQTQQEVQQVQDVAGITYLTEGLAAGRPSVVFLHGVGGAARQWGPVLERLGRTRHVVAWDMPGHGGSAPLPLVTMDALAAALGGFLRALGLTRPVLVGHSLGGMIVQRLLAEAPHAASAVVLAQTSAAFGSREPAWADSFIRDRLGPLDEGRSMAELAPGLVAEMTGDAPDPAGVTLAEACLAHTPDASYRDTIKAMTGFDLRAALPGITVPTLLLAGEKDSAAPVAGMQRMADRIQGARMVVVPGAGHLAHLERPDAFCDALEPFLAEVAA